MIPEPVAIQIIVALCGIAGGLLTAIKRMQMSSKASMSASNLTMMAFETEVTSLLRQMRSDMDRGMLELNDGQRAIMRRLSKYDDELSDLQIRVRKLED